MLLQRMCLLLEMLLLRRGFSLALPRVVPRGLLLQERILTQQLLMFQRRLLGSYRPLMPLRQGVLDLRPSLL